MKRPLLIVDVVVAAVALWLIVAPTTIESGGARFAVFSMCAVWLLFRWSSLVMGRTRSLLSDEASKAQKAEGYYLRALVVLMVAIVLTITVRFLLW